MEGAKSRDRRRSKSLSRDGNLEIISNETKIFQEGKRPRNSVLQLIWKGEEISEFL